MESEAKNLISWKYYFSDLDSRQYNDEEVISESEFLTYLQSVPNLKLYLASYKFNTDLPTMDFMVKNFIQGVYQRLSTHIRNHTFSIALLEQDPKRFVSLWIFDTESGNKFLLESPKKSKSNDPEDGDAVSEDKDIYELFDWRELNLLEVDLLSPFFKVTTDPRVVYK
jgi:hypothetical protein